MLIYRFLLDHFTDEQRFSITTKISHSILGKGLSFKVCQTDVYVRPQSSHVIFLSLLALLLSVYYLFLPRVFSVLCG